MKQAMKVSGLRICFLSKRAPAYYKDLDYKILSRRFSIVRHDYTYSPINILRFLGKVWRCDAVFVWFANPWFSLLSWIVPKRVKRIVVAGGYDVANCPELNYGARRHFLQGVLTRHLLLHADLVLPVSEFNRAELLDWVKPRQQQLVYNAVEFPLFSLLTDVPRKRKVITVGAVQAFISIRKGHDRFIEVAKLLPDVEFVLVGKNVDGTMAKLQADAPPNVRFTGYVTRQELLQELLSASVYLQLSVHEAFGVSVAEAVACGCFPVVAAGTALPEVIGQAGEVVDATDRDAAARAVEAALRDESYWQVDPGRVRQEFSSESREKKLVRALEALFHE